MNNIWIANISTAAVILTVMGFLLKRYVDMNDKRHEANEHEMKEIKKNYNSKFEGVHEKIEETKEVLVEEMQKIQRDKHEYRYEQAKAMGVLETKIDGAVGYFKEMREDIKELRRDNRDFDRKH